MEVIVEDISDTPSFVADLVSIIVPAYNSEKYLDQCVESVLRQSYEKLELILIDDGSTDGSGEICDGHAGNHGMITVIHTANNGPAAARNEGIKRSRGEFIYFMDSDDIMEKEALKELIENYKQHKSDMITGDFYSISNGNYGPGFKGVFPGSEKLGKQDVMNYARKYLKKPNRFTLFAYSWGRLFKASIVKRNNIFFDADLHTFEDVAFNFSYLRFADGVFYLAKGIYGHQIHDNYMSATMTITGDPKRMFGYGSALAEIGKFLEYGGSNADVKKEVGHAFVSLTIIQLVRICGQINNDNRKKIYELVRGTVCDPELRGNLACYSPTEGDSRILPVLMKLKLIRPITWVCLYKARRRYGRRGASK